jgi:hypothetical protein
MAAPKKTAPAKTSMKEPVKAPPAGEKSFEVTMKVTGTMLDKDTPIGEVSLVDYFEMMFAAFKGISITGVKAKEL